MVGTQPEAPPRSKRTLPPEVRKAQLLAAARGVLGEVGFSNLRVDEVVRRAGLSKGTFYLYFPSKEEIVFELARNLIADAMVALEGTLSAEEDLRSCLKRVMNSYYRVCFSYRDVLEGTEAGVAAGLDHVKWNEIYRPLNEFALSLVKTWQARGEIRPDVDPNVVSWLFIDTINGALARLFGRSGNRISEDYEDQIVAWTYSALTHFPPPAAPRSPASGKS